ncbi:MAG: hypothetical protein EPO08_12355 [Rhodospirillaceae bacterium]|nr:MAG: hypothetical protein EPO08_12355 [Rhodospirillaceae bacterium]
MSTTNFLLPAGFEALEPFVKFWAVAGATARAQRRNDCSEQERAAFYDTAKELLAPALAYLDRKPLNKFDEKEKRLMNMLLSLAHVVQAVEVLAQDEEKHAEARRHMKITRATADLNS